VGLSAEVSCTVAPPSTARLAPGDSRRLPPTRRAWLAGIGWTEAALRRFETMADGDAVAGPALVESAFTTVVVDPGARARRLPSGTLIIAVGEAT
jgi:N-methylhydantoinase A